MNAELNQVKEGDHQKVEKLWRMSQKLDSLDDLTQVATPQGTDEESEVAGEILSPSISPRTSTPPEPKPSASRKFKTAGNISYKSPKSNQNNAVLSRNIKAFAVERTRSQETVLTHEGEEPTRISETEKAAVESLKEHRGMKINRRLKEALDAEEPESTFGSVHRPTQPVKMHPRPSPRGPARPHGRKEDGRPLTSRFNFSPNSRRSHVNYSPRSRSQRVLDLYGRETPVGTDRYKDLPHFMWYVFLFT